MIVCVKRERSGNGTRGSRRHRGPWPRPWYRALSTLTRSFPLQERERRKERGIEYTRYINIDRENVKEVEGDGGRVKVRMRRGVVTDDAKKKIKSAMDSHFDFNNEKT